VFADESVSGFDSLPCHTELREQLLARSSRVDDMERLKADFSQQRQEIKQQNEVELESLRR